MKTWAKSALYWLTMLIALNDAIKSSAAVAVLTQHNDLARTGANLGEKELNVTNVNAEHFGLIFARSVDDEVYAQPLVMTNVAIPGKGAHNLLIVATVSDSVYAFDADDASAAAAYWHKSFLGPKIFPPRNSDMYGACPDFTNRYQDYDGNMGIVGTPVIDGESGTLYVVARTKMTGLLGDTFMQHIHALNIATGAELTNSPALITASIEGDGAGNIGGVIKFDPLRQNQRAGLALVKGTIYVGWASHCDWEPYHGWLLGYDATTLKPSIVFNTTPDGDDGGIWMSGQAPSADSRGNLYITVGNGTVGRKNKRAALENRGESLLKLGKFGDSLQVMSSFTPHNWQELEDGDIDFGSTGVLLIPGTALACCGSKEGKLYLVNRDHMGGLSGSNEDTNIVQSFQVTRTNAPNNIHGTPVWWSGANGEYAYVWGESDFLRQYKFDRNSGKFVLPCFAQSPMRAPAGMPGGFLSISGDGSSAGSAILWASYPLSGDANRETRPGILRAFSATNVAVELWNSEQVKARDSIGNFAKFCPPTIANGKVYTATFSRRVNVYGLLKTQNDSSGN